MNSRLRIVLGAIAIGSVTLGFGGAAHAQRCVDTSNNSQDSWTCTAPNTSPFADSTPWKVRIGSDSEGQWIGWLAPDGSCFWDQIGPPSGMNANLFLSTHFGEDDVRTVDSEGVTFCGFPLLPPITANRFMAIGGSYGIDKLITGTGPTILYAEDTGGSSGNQLITRDPGGALYGGDGGDQLIIAMSTPYYPFIVGAGGNDIVLMPKRGTGIYVDCGAGQDSYCGPSSYVIGCDIPVTICNNW